MPRFGQVGKKDLRGEKNSLMSGPSDLEKDVGASSAGRSSEAETRARAQEVDEGGGGERRRLGLSHA